MQYGRNEWRAKVSFGRTMMQALELLRSAKRHVSALENEGIRLVAIAIIDLCLSEGIIK